MRNASRSSRGTDVPGRISENSPINRSTALQPWASSSTIAKRSSIKAPRVKVKGSKQSFSIVHMILQRPSSSCCNSSAVIIPIILSRVCATISGFTSLKERKSREP